MHNIIEHQDHLYGFITISLRLRSGRSTAHCNLGKMLGCFGVSALRAHLAFSLSVFPQAPLSSRTVEFPESGWQQ